MAHEIVMPRVDMDMATGRMGAWRAAEGAHVVKGETLFEIETDKAAMEVDAPASGVLRFVAASEGDVLPVGSCIGWVVAEGEDFVPPVTSPTAALATPDSSARADVEENDAVYADAAVGLRATPAARRAARERGLRLADVKGSGPKGRIQARDLEQCAVGEPRMLSVNREWLRRGEGAPIVFIHGLCADLNGWRPLFRLLPETRPALAIDLPGHGLSPLGEEASFDALVDAARSVMIEEGATSAHLVGHSLGGAVAAVLSQAPGVKALSLMLIAPAGLGEETNPAFFDGFLQADDEAALTPWLNLLVTDPASLGSALAPATLRQRTDGWYLTLAAEPSWRGAVQRQTVTTELLGKTVVSQCAFEHRDGSPLSLNTDYLGERRDQANPFPGPFETVGAGRREIKVWPVEAPPNGSR